MADQETGESRDFWRGFSRGMSHMHLADEEVDELREFETCSAVVVISLWGTDDDVYDSVFDRACDIATGAGVPVGRVHVSAHRVNRQAGSSVGEAVHG